MSMDKFRAFVDGMNKHFDNEPSELISTNLDNDSLNDLTKKSADDLIIDNRLTEIKDNISKILDKESRILNKEKEQEEHIKSFENKIEKFTESVERIEQTEEDLKKELSIKINKMDIRPDVVLMKQDLDLVKEKISDAIGLENRHAAEIKSNIDHMEFSLAEEYHDEKEMLDDNKDDLRQIKGRLSEINSRFDGVEFVTRQEMKNRMGAYDSIKREVQLNRREILMVEQDIRQMIRLVEKLKSQKNSNPEKIKNFESKIDILKGKALVIKEEKEKPITNFGSKEPLTIPEKSKLSKAKFEKVELPGPVAEIEYHPEYTKEVSEGLVNKFLHWIKGY